MNFASTSIRRRGGLSATVGAIALVALLLGRAQSAQLPMAGAESAAVPLAHAATSVDEVALVDRLYPPTGSPRLRRSALGEALAYFPDDSDMKLRVGVRLALMDWSEGHPRRALQRLKMLLASRMKVNPDVVGWAQVVEGRLLAALGEPSTAIALFDPMVIDPSFPAARRVTAAAADADLRSASAPAAALQWLRQVERQADLRGAAFEAEMARLLILNGQPDEINQRLELLVEDPAEGEKALGAVLKAAQEWDLQGDGERLSQLVEIVRRVRPNPSPSLQAAIGATRAAATALSLQSRLAQVVNQPPVAPWAKGLPADATTDLETFTLAIDDATRRNEPERSLRLSLRALASHPADPSFPKLLFSAAQFADWVQRSKPASIDARVADRLLGLCNLLAVTNPYFTEGKFLEANRAMQRGDRASEREALTEVVGVPDQSADYLAPAYRQLGLNLERSGEYRKALETYAQAESMAASHRAAAECVLRAAWINLSFGTDHEAMRLIRLLGDSPPAVTHGLAGSVQLKELEEVLKSGRAIDIWTANRGWWGDWAHLAIGFGAPSDLLEYGVPEIPNPPALEESIRRSGASGDFKSYIRDLTILMSAARWQPSLGPEAAALCGEAVKTAGDAGVDLRGVLIRMLACPHPSEIPGDRERRLCLALNYLDVHQPQECLRVAGEFFDRAQPEDNTTRTMHRIRALAALAANQDYAESAAGLEADLGARVADGQRAMSVALLADLYRRMGRDADGDRLIHRELAGAALAGDPDGRAALEGKLARIAAGSSKPPPVPQFVRAINLEWFDYAEPKDLRDPRITSNPNLLASLDQVFGPTEQVKYLLLAADDEQLRPEDRNRLFIEAAVRLTGWCQNYSQINSLTSTVVDDPGFDPQIRLGVLWNTLSLLAREGRSAEFARWRSHPLCQQLGQDYQARLALLGREAALDRNSPAAISGLAETVARQPLTPAGMLLERDALDDLLQIGALTDASALEAKAAAWNFAPGTQASSAPFQVELSRRLRVAQALNPVHEALAAAVLERFPDPSKELPPAYNDLRLSNRLITLGPDETFRAGLAQIASRSFDRQDLQFWGTLFRAWPSSRSNAIDAVVRAGLAAASDDQLRAQAIVLCFTSFDVDDSQVRQQLEREFVPYRSQGDHPSCFLAIRLYEIDRDLRLGRAFKLNEAFVELSDARVAQLRERILLRHATQLSDRAAVRQALDQIEPARLLSADFVADAVPALAIAGTAAEVAAARGAAAQVLRQRILAAWSGQDPAANDSALDLALALGNAADLPPPWVAALESGADPLLRARSRLVRTYLAGDWPGVERAAAALNEQYPTRYSFFWYRALALHHLGRDREAEASLRPYLEHAHDEPNYSAAQALAASLGLVIPAGA